MPFLGSTAVWFIVLGVLIALYNWSMCYLTYRSGRFRSSVPFASPFAIVLGLLMLRNASYFAWLLLLIDYGTLIALRSLPKVLKEMWSISNFNLLKQYVGQEEGRTVRLRLFRQGDFVIRQQFTRDPTRFEMFEKGKWKRKNSELKLELGKDLAVFEVGEGKQGEILRQVTEFRRFENTRLSLGRLELELQR